MKGDFIMSQPKEIRVNEAQTKFNTGSPLSEMPASKRHELTARFAKYAAYIEQTKEQSAEKNNQRPGNTRDTADSSRSTETGGTLSLQDLAKTAYNWIESFKQGKPNPSGKEVTMYYYAVERYNETLESLKKHGVPTDLKPIVPSPIGLLGGANTDTDPRR